MSLFSSVRLLFYVDTSASPHRLYVGSVSQTLDADGYPVSLESETGLARQ